MRLGSVVRVADDLGTCACGSTDLECEFDLIPNKGERVGDELLVTIQAKARLVRCRSCGLTEDIA